LLRTYVCGWNTEDIEFLNSLSKDDYLKWMKGNPENIVIKIRAGLLTFQNIRTSNGDQARKECMTI